jgi:hypothetical protein
LYQEPGVARDEVSYGVTRHIANRLQESVAKNAGGLVRLHLVNITPKPN